MKKLDRENIEQELAKFNQINFDAQSHSYTVDSQALISVTSLLGQYKKPFDTQYWAQIKATQRDVALQIVLDEWETKAQQSQIRGNALHHYLEMSLTPTVDGEKICANDYQSPLKNLADKFLNDIQGKMTAIKSEFRVGDLDLRIAGTVDQLFFNHKSQQLEIWDWKSNQKIAQESRYSLIGGLEHLADCELTVYSLQLEMYRYLLRHNCQLQLGNCYIAWFNENNSDYKVFKTLDLSTEIAMICQQRRLSNSVISELK